MAIGKTVLEGIGLRKSYGARLALDGLVVTVAAGEVVGLLGPNGAGKTTTLSILATLLAPDSGEIRLAGASIDSNRGLFRRKLGFVPQVIALYPSLSALQNLRLFARVVGMRSREARDAAGRALEEVGLADRADDPVATLSGGMKRRLNLACGMVHRPEFLLLDEPTVGIDPQSREQILTTIRRAAASGTGVIYSTHYMEEVERICDRALLIDSGRIVAQGSIANLIALGGRHPRLEIIFEHTPPTGWTNGIPGVTALTDGEGGRVTIELAGLDQVGVIIERARAIEAKVIEFSVHSPNLSDAFIALTGHALRDNGPLLS